MNTITLTNDFHRTEVDLRPRNWELSPRQVARARKALCGIKDCTCGDAVGARGVQPWVVLVYPDGHGQIIDGRKRLEEMGY